MLRLWQHLETKQRNHSLEALPETILLCFRSLRHLFEAQGSAQDGSAVDSHSSQDLLEQLAQHAKAVAAAAEVAETTSAAAAYSSLVVGSCSKDAQRIRLQTASTAERAVDEVLLELNDLLNSSGASGLGRLGPFSSSAIRSAIAPQNSSGSAATGTTVGSSPKPGSPQKSPVRKKKAAPVEERAPWDNSKVGLHCIKSADHNLMNEFGCALSSLPCWQQTYLEIHMYGSDAYSSAGSGRS
jgi:hypothetical protein